MSRRPNCKAQQRSDQMYCPECNVSWDINDPDPPECQRGFKPGYIDPQTLRVAFRIKDVWAHPESPDMTIYLLQPDAMTDPWTICDGVDTDRSESRFWLDLPFGRQREVDPDFVVFLSAKDAAKLKSTITAARLKLIVDEHSVEFYNLLELMLKDDTLNPVTFTATIKQFFSMRGAK